MYADINASRAAEGRSHPFELARWFRGKIHKNDWQLILSITPPTKGFLSPSFTLFLVSEQPIFIPTHMERQRRRSDPVSDGEARSGILRIKPQ